MPFKYKLILIFFMPSSIALRTVNRNVKPRFKFNCVIGASVAHHQNPGYRQQETQQCRKDLQSIRYSPIHIQHSPNFTSFHRLRNLRFLNRNRNPYPASHPKDFQSIPTTTTQTTTQTRTIMASDASYLSFLEKANQDPSAGSSQAAQSEAEGGFVSTKTVDQNVNEVPQVLKSVDVDYISDTDEPFEAVALMWEGAGKGEWPSSGEMNSALYDANKCFC